VVARALAPTLQLPDGLDQGLTAEPGSSPAWVHVARMCAALGALLRFAPRPGWWAAQAHSAAQQLELEGAAVRAAITQRAEDDRVAMTISGGRVRPMRELTRRVDRIARP
jgi:hypothetical protein